MRCTIIHESSGRMRVHMHQCYMSLEDADKLQAYLDAQSSVKRAVVSERTADATIFYLKRAGMREAVIAALSSFHYDTCEVEVPEHSSRQIQHEYEDRMFWHIFSHYAIRFFLPVPVRTVVCLVKAVPFVIKGIRSLSKGSLDVHVLDAVSVSAAIARSDFDTASSVMFMLGIGDLMEDWTRRKSVADLADAMSLHADKVWVKTEDGEEVLVDTRTVRKGDHMVVRTGNLIPLDGIVESGDAMVNQSSITGEPLPVHRQEGGAVFAGSVLEEGELVVHVTKEAGTGQYDRIAQMIQESEQLKSKAEIKAGNRADKLVPVTFIATALTWLLTQNATRAYSILMVDFCCALKLSIPLAALSAMREGSMHGILIKSGKTMEDLAEAETIVFDKTGTLTKAEPTVKDVVAFNGNDPKEMLRLAACLEEHYPHSIANAVVKEAVRQDLRHEEKHSKVQYIVAHGIASEVDGVQVRIGSGHFIFEDEGAAVPEGEQEKFDALPAEYSHLCLAIGGVLSAVILIEDPLKENAADIIRQLHDKGFQKAVMLTGDSQRTAAAVATRIGVDDYRAEVLPQDKARYLKEEKAAGHKTVMVGDGINDSPALSEADVGVAMNSGAAIAREVADVMVSANDLTTMAALRELSTRLQKRINGNYHFIMGFNTFLIILGAIGVLPPTMTALLHNGSTILISLRSMTDLLGDEEERAV